jgi:ferredoxin
MQEDNRIGVRVRQARCTRVRFSESACRECIASCPAQAIRIGDGRLRIDRACTGCLLCLPACPNDVFVSEPEADAETIPFPDLLYCSALLPPKTPTLTDLPSCVVPCLGSIPPHRVIERVLHGRVPLQVITGYCHSCPMKTGEFSFRKREAEIVLLLTLFKVETVPLTVRAGTDQDRLNLSAKVEEHGKNLKEKEAFSRRDLFLRFRDRVLKPDEAARRRTRVYSDDQGPSEYMRSVIAFVQAYESSESQPPEIPFLREIRVQEGCTGCGVCAALCPTGALKINEDQGRVELLWRPAHCSRCNLCVESCCKKAIRFLPGVETRRIAGQTSRAIMRFYRNLCPECGDSFLSPGPETRCVRCSKREKVVEDLFRMIYK